MSYFKVWRGGRPPVSTCGTDAYLPNITYYKDSFERIETFGFWAPGTIPRKISHIFLGVSCCRMLPQAMPPPLDLLQNL